MESHIVDGNNILGSIIFCQIKSFDENQSTSYFLEFKTFRMRGHEGRVVQNMFRKINGSMG
jgi:hypothetical protein